MTVLIRPQTQTQLRPQTLAGGRAGLTDVDSGIDPAMLSLKSQLKDSWTAGDFGVVAPVLSPGTETFLLRNPVAAGERALDAACGDGQLAIPMARAGARVTGIDIAPNLVAQARERAAREGLSIRFDEGDVEQMPYEDGAFDVVTSFFGAMFAPRPWLAAGEMLRVTRPGGRILMASWTPEGFIGQMFKLIARYAPPSPLMPPPLMWGDEDVVRRRFGDAVAELRTARYRIPFLYPYGVEGVVRHYRTYFGPMIRAFDRLDAARQEDLEQDLIALWDRHNQAGPGQVCVESEMLEVVAVKA